MDSIIVLTPHNEAESASRLGFPTYSFINRHTEDYDAANTIVIRWGYGGENIAKDGKTHIDFKNVINPGKAIALNCDKHLAIKRMAKVVNVPALYEKVIPKNVTAVVRNHQHSAGEGFSVQRGKTALKPFQYGAKYLKTKTEYRVLFCGNKTLTISRVDIRRNKPRENYVCRSMWGYGRFFNTPKSLHQATLKAARAIGLECGGADVLRFKNKYYFLELNSAITLDNKRIKDFFIVNLSRLMAKKFPHYKEVKPKKMKDIKISDIF